jgi:hypothetical protein
LAERTEKAQNPFTVQLGVRIQSHRLVHMIKSVRATNEQHQLERPPLVARKSRRLTATAPAAQGVVRQVVLVGADGDAGVARSLHRQPDAGGPRAANAPRMLGEDAPAGSVTLTWGA